MKVILVNGSPHQNGTTAFALGVVADALKQSKQADIETEIIQIEHLPLRCCIACGYCYKAKECVHKDGLNEIAAKIHDSDGLVVGSPVYYAGINGTLKCFLDRLFYSGTGKFRFKPAAGVVALRRGGGTSALQSITRYFEFAEMLITPTMYWSAIHGMNGEQAAQDEEGVQMMQVIGRNMAHLLEMRAKSGLAILEVATKVKTNFIK